MRQMYRENVMFASEVRELVLGDLVLSVAYSIFLSQILSNGRNTLQLLIYLFPIALVAVSLSFILHELMHKFAAQHFGAFAAFKTSPTGLMITIISPFLGLLFGIPGATYIYKQLTVKEDGYVSLAGPLTNFVVFGVFFSLGMLLYSGFPGQVISIFESSAQVLSNPYLENMLDLTVFLSIYLAFYNMLPIMPLDGSKVLR